LSTAVRNSLRPMSLYGHGYRAQTWAEFIPQ
jgi:hypothetical protein